MITVIPAYEPDEKMIKLVKELLAETAAQRICFPFLMRPGA